MVASFRQKIFEVNYFFGYQDIDHWHHWEKVANTEVEVALDREIGITFANWKFRYSKSFYFFDKDSKVIYKGLSNIKSIGEQVGDDLYLLRNNEYDSFVDLLCELLKIKSINFGMLKILIMLDFFEEFGKSQKLLTILDYFDRFYNKKQFSTSDNIVFDSEYKLKYAPKEKKIIKSYE